MKKLVTALMIVLPLVFLIALFTVTNVTRITAQIPATGIVISNKGENGVFVLDIADYESPLFEEDLDIQVMPLVASNRKYTLSVTDAESGEATDIVELKEDGSFALNDVGLAKLTFTSNDGGYQDSVIFNVSSSGVLEMNAPTVKDSLGNALTVEEGVDTDYAVTVENGAYNIGANCYPSTVTTAQPRYIARNNDAIDVNEVSGNVQTRFSGNHVVEISVEDARGDIITKTLEVRVQKNSGETTINGKPLTAGMRFIAPLNSKSLTLYIDADRPVNENEFDLTGTNFKGYDVKKLDNISNTAYEVVITFENETELNDLASFNLTMGGVVTKFSVECSDYQFEVHSALHVEQTNDILMLDGIETNFSISASPINSGITYEWQVEDAFKDLIEITQENGQYCKIKANMLGRAEIKVICRYENGGFSEVTKKIVVTQNYSSLMFNEIAHSYGLGLLAIANGKYDDDFKIVNTEYKSEFDARIGKDKAPSLNDIEFSSSNDAIAKATLKDGNVYFDIKANGKVTITAKSKYAKELKIQPATVTFNAVNGVTVTNYAQLMQASKDGKKTVLANDIYLGEKLSADNPDWSKTKLLEYTKEMKTTFDWTYYENRWNTQPTVRYCYEFTNDLFGNGYTLNGEYLTNNLDATDKPYDWAVFKGPLDFVAAQPDNQTIAAVKAQDNIVFLTRTDDVTIDNVILKGCNDESIYDNGEINLSLLNYMGTTLEVMSNARLTNSRVMNGRTVMRVFGRDGVNRNSNVNVSAEKINVEIDNCILQNAREFILKIGTNRAILAPNENNLEPTLTNASGKPYTNSNSPLCDNYINDDYFVNNYVLTDVILKDSILRTSGLFTIGMESHFAGGFLYNSVDSGLANLLPGWKNLAATSYPAMLHLVGNVKLADWKDLANIDSSTLIETPQTEDFANIGKWLSLDINKMLQVVKEKGGENYKNIIDVIDGKNYVHGGIAFYGGGRNYSILDTSQYTFEKMNQYNVNISILKDADKTDEAIKKQGEMLPLAAGTQDFRFVMFDASSNFDYNAQQKEME